jgi:glycerol-3-phosphate acyltransferase PlsY
VSVGSLAAVVCYPLFLSVLGLATPPRLVFASVVLVLVVVRHKANLGRLVRGEEHRA